MLIKGFFVYYKNLNEDSLNIKKNLDQLKIFDNIRDTFKVIDKYKNLKISHNITEIFSNYNSFWEN